LVVYVSLFISLFGLEITKLFTKGTIYWEAYKLIPILSLGIIFAMLKDTSVIGLQITKRTKIIGVALSGIAVLNLGLNIVLIPLFDIFGAAFSSFISQVAFFIILHSYAQKHYHIPYRLDRVFSIIAIGVVLFFAGSLFNDYSLKVRMLAKLISLLIFPLLVFAFGVFDKTEIDAFKSFIVSFKNIFNKIAPKEVDEQISKVDEPQ